MYTAFNLKIKLEDFEKYDELISIGRQRKEKLQTDSETELKKFTLPNGVIDGTGLSETWFQAVQSDIFISHSHNDESLAFALAGWLKQVFNLNVFMDEVVWESADELLQTVDKKYCWQPESKTFSYKKRNLTTSHIHAMLSTAIYSVMDKTEVVIFLNTDESMPDIIDTLKENSTYTLSPWIYQELMATKLLRITDWSEYRETVVLEHSQYKHDSADIKIAYRTPVNELQVLDADTLCQWDKNYNARKDQPYGGLFVEIPDHPLNYLYDIALGAIK